MIKETGEIHNQNITVEKFPEILAKAAGIAALVLYVNKILNIIIF